MLENILDTIICADSLEYLPTLPANSIDALCTDPPASISFMGKTWDSDKGGRRNWVNWLTGILKECCRVLKPGGYGFIWSLPRTSHWTALAIEKSGLEIRDCVYDLLPGDNKLLAFLEGLNEEQRQAFFDLAESQNSPFLLSIFGTGFPKSLDISKTLDNMAHAKREVVGEYKYASRKGGKVVNTYMADWSDRSNLKETVPATDLAKKYDGWGTALKPAVECWWLVRKPLSEKTVAENVLKWGTGGINIDSTRVGWEKDGTKRQERTSNRISPNPMDWGEGKIIPRNYKPVPEGRWPSHLLISHTLFCTDEQCDEQCPVFIMDKQSGMLKSGETRPGQPRIKSFGKGGYHNHFPDTTSIHGSPASEGGASRFFAQFSPDVPFLYGSKAGVKERNEGLEHLPKNKNDYRPNDPEENSLRTRLHGSIAKQNTHPTVKPLSLVKYLIKQITPENGIVLDPFLGSGTTGVACLQEGFHFIGIEKEKEYVTIAEARLQPYLKK